MKKLMIITALLLFAGIAVGQTLSTGNLIGTHVLKMEMNEGVTLDQCVTFMKDRYIPETEKLYEGAKLFLMQPVRGVHENSLGMLVWYKNEAARDKYYNDDGTPSDLGNKTLEKFAPVMEEMGKLGTVTTEYTDWILVK